MEIHLTATARNGALVRAMKIRGWTQAELARQARVSPNVVSILVRMRYDSDDCPRSPDSESIQAIADVLGLDPEDVLNPTLAGKSLTTEHETYVRVDPQRLASSHDLRLIEPPESAAIREEEAEDVRAAVAGLSYRQARVLTLRYGLDGGGPRSLREVGREIGVTRQGLHAIEKRAIRRLREAPGTPR